MIAARGPPAFQTLSQGQKGLPFWRTTTHGCSVLNHKLTQLQLVAHASTGQQQGLDTATTLQPAVATSQQQERQARQQQLQQQWYEQSSVYYSNYPLNRAAEQRRDEKQLAEWFDAPNAQVTPVRGSKVLLCTTSTSNKYCPVWVSPAADLGAALSTAVPPIFLGLDANGTPHFAVQIAAAAAADGLAASQAASWVSARTAGPDMSLSDAALMAVASGLAQWNLDTQYHGTSGAQTLPKAGGFSRRCSSTGRSVYPRIDPAIITLVTCGPDWCLLGRKAGWPTGRYSTLAGFLELGETLEQALCREVLEESGVAADLHSVRYVASQPWPFPRSLMVGFYAEAAGADAAAAGAVDWLSHQGRMAMMDTGLRPVEVASAVQGLRLQQPTPQEDEMEDVRWFHRDWLQWALQKREAAAPGSFFIPGNYSLAFRLITGWLGNSSSNSSSSQGQVSSPDGNGSSNGSSSTGSAWLGDQVPEVDIDQGVFKYVLLRLTDSRDSSKSKLLVRGSSAAAYHNHILQHTKAQLQQLSAGALDVQVVGGGRIEHYPEQQVISVYGYSAAFGPAVHEVTAGLLNKWYPFYSHITWSYDGY